ncbi:MAG: hypothetical protein ABI353_15460 [Isosphaeraceae bacterium]
MSQHVSRRSVLKVASAGGLGLAGAGLTAKAVEAAYRTGGLSPGDLAGLPHLADHVRPTDRAALGRDEVLKIKSAHALASRVVEVHFSPGEGLSHLGVDLRQQAAEFLCDPRRPNLLVHGVSRLAYEIVEVAWRPGEGSPVCRGRSPHTDPAIGMRYAGVPRYQIVLIDDRAVYVGNSGTSGVIDGIEGPVRIDVNGLSHAEHQGYYKVLITAIA